MTRFPRVVLSFILSILILIGIIHFMLIPRDVIIPPPLLYNDCTAKTNGWVTGTREQTGSNHILEGTDPFYWMAYKYAPKVEGQKSPKDPNASANWLNDEVRVTEEDFNQVQPGHEVSVVYDPGNPHISGVPNTQGLWGRRTGWMNPYLWWYLGIIVATYIIQEIIRMATRTAD